MPTSSKDGTGAAVEQTDPDLSLLAGLVLAGLVDPTDALVIALVQTDQHHSR